MLKLELTVNQDGDTIVHRTGAYSVDTMGKVLLAMKKIEAEMVSCLSAPNASLISNSTPSDNQTQLFQS